MTMLYIILGGLFLITWIVIAVSCTKIDTNTACEHACTCKYEPFMYGRACPHQEVDRLRAELGGIRSQIRELREEKSKAQTQAMLNAMMSPGTVIPYRTIERERYVSLSWLEDKLREAKED